MNVLTLSLSEDRLGRNCNSLSTLNVTGNSGRLFGVGASRGSLERLGNGRSFGLSVALSRLSDLCLLAVLGDGSRLAHNVFRGGGLEGLSTNKGSRLGPSGLSLLSILGNSGGLARVVNGRGSLVGSRLGRLVGVINLRSSGRLSRVTVSTSSSGTFVRMPRI